MAIKRAATGDNTPISNRWEFLLRCIDHLGFPAVIACVLLAGAWVLGDRVTLAHLTTLKVVQESILKQADVMDRMAQAVQNQDANVARQVKAGEERTALLQVILDEQKKTRVAIENLGK